MIMQVRMTKICEATKWEGQPVPGLTRIEPNILFDKQERYYYVIGYHSPGLNVGMANAWLAVDPERETAAGNDLVFPFFMYSLKSGPSVAATDRPELLARYVEHMGWPPSYGIYGVIGNQKVDLGNWIVDLGDHVEVYSDQAFAERFEAVP